MLKLCLLPNRAIRLGITFGLLLLLPVFLNAQNKTITGTVKDESGVPVNAASVTVKGTVTGTTTNEQGSFSINAPAGATLEISAVDHETIEVKPGDQLNLSIVLRSRAGNLEDVVVVGYATQKKVNMTGAVSTISSADLTTRPVTNVSSALSGLASGVFVRQGSGKPGYDGATIRIRGVGSLNDSDPLVLIDGIIGTMDAVNPDDIQSISILKDAASAAIYGAQAANGVVLITTKKGNRGKTTVTYTGYLSSARPLGEIKFVSNYARHMRLINESLTNVGQTIIFPAARIEEWETATANPNGTNTLGVPNWLAYPNTNWYDAVFKNKMAQGHNIALNGGNEKMLYQMSINYLNNPGVMDKTGTERYQFRVNLESKINKVITVGTQTFASLQTIGMANTDLAFNFLSQTSPGVHPMYEGRFGYPAAPEESPNANNIAAYLYGTGGKNLHNRINTTLYANFNIMKGLVFESKVNYQQRTQELNSHTVPTDRWDFGTNTLRFATNTPNFLSTSYSFNKDYRITLDNVLRYSTNIGSDHQISALAGYNEFYFNYYDFSATKTGLIDYDITTLGSALDVDNKANGQETDRAIRSWFGRINYVFKDRYLLEGNLRYDGSSRFDKRNRWGYYPSISAGWRISEEGFFSGLKDKISNLKLRASWGELGNNGSGDFSNDYAYQAVYGPVNYSFNGIAASGLRQGRISNPMLQWESTRQTNVALEATLFRSINIELDWYHRLTDGILTTPPVAAVLGTATAPLQNTAAVLNKGIDLTIGWNKRMGDFNLSVSGNMGYNKNEVTKFKGKLEEGFKDVNGVPTYSSNIGAVSNNGANSLILEGRTMYDFYLHTLYKGNGTYTNGDGSVNINGGPRDGMIRTVEDLNWVKAMIAAGYRFAPVSTVATTSNKTLLNYGDFIYADNNGDGIYGNNFDRKFTNTSTAPRFNFGFNLNLTWKDFDLGMIWTGSTGMQYYWQNGFNTVATRNGFHITEAIANDHYYYNEANPSDPNNNINATFPRLKYNADAQNQAYSTFWLYDASYFKLKNLQIGYTIPSRIASKALISRARVYLSGENLLLITKYPGLDPEIGPAMGYPTLRQFAAGVTVTF